MDSRSSAHTVVVVAGVLMFAYVLIVGPRNGRQSTYKALWAVGLLTLGLSFLADVAPELAAPLALLVLIGAYLRHPGVFGRVIGNATG